MIDTVTAVAPALGVRIGRLGGTQDGAIVLQAMDEGARGYPRELILLAVQVQVQVQATADGPVPRVQRPSGLPPFCAADLCSAACVRHRNTSKDGLYRLPLPGNVWPTEPAAAEPGGHLLLLLLYNQAPGVPGASSLPPGHLHLPYSDATLADELNALLAREDARSLGGGLIRRCVVPTPEPAAAITLLLASCHYPHDVLDRMPHIADPEVGPADASMFALARVLDALPTPALLLLAGDQVYVDATAGLFDPASRDDLFGRPYALAGASPGSQAALQRTQLLVQRLIDDHEISDNWQRGDADHDTATAALPSRVQLGIEAFWRHQRLMPASPEPDWRRRKAWQTQAIWFEAPFHGRSIFYGDTRTERQARKAEDFSTRQIMGAAQHDALRAWLLQHAATPGPKFIATPAMLLPRRLAARRHPAAALHCDTWEGYPLSLHSLLAFVCQHQIAELVFLSGDEHLSCIARADIAEIGGSRQCVIHSIHSSALYAPYPFANAGEADFAHSECFEFADPVHSALRYRCRVQTWFAPPGDGFAVITAPASGPLSVAFHGAEGAKPGASFVLPLELHLETPDLSR